MSCPVTKTTVNRKLRYLVLVRVYATARMLRAGRECLGVNWCPQDHVLFHAT